MFSGSIGVPGGIVSHAVPFCYGAGTFWVRPVGSWVLDSGNVVARGLAVSLDKPLGWGVGFFFGNVELSLELWTTITAGSYYLTVTDNAAEIGGSTAIANNTYTVSIWVPKGAITVSLASASTGDTVTLAGSNFPPNTTASTLTIDGSNAMPPGGIVTDSDGRFAEVIEIPAATTGGSLSPGTQIISVKIGTITGIDGGFSTP